MGNWKVVHADSRSGHLDGYFGVSKHNILQEIVAICFAIQPHGFDTNIKLLHDYSIISGAFSQRFSDKGAIRGRHPTDYHLGPKTSVYIPDYQLEWILMIKEHYMFYKDHELVRQVYPNLKLLLKYFESYESDERNLLEKFRVGLF